MFGKEWNVMSEQMWTYDQSNHANGFFLLVGLSEA